MSSGSRTVRRGGERPAGTRRSPDRLREETAARTPMRRRCSATSASAASRSSPSISAAGPGARARVAGAARNGASLHDDTPSRRRDGSHLGRAVLDGLAVRARCSNAACDATPMAERSAARRTQMAGILCQSRDRRRDRARCVRRRHQRAPTSARRRRRHRAPARILHDVAPVERLALLEEILRAVRSGAAIHSTTPETIGAQWERRCRCFRAAATAFCTRRERRGVRGDGAGLAPAAACA